MNTDHLSRDLTEDLVVQAARRKRQGHLIQRLSLVVLFCLPAIITFWPSQEPSQAENSSERPASQGDQTEFTHMEIIESDEELLALLEEFGPVLATHSDGSKTLLLTANTGFQSLEQ